MALEQLGRTELDLPTPDQTPPEFGPRTFPMPSQVGQATPAAAPISDPGSVMARKQGWLATFQEFARSPNGPLTLLTTAAELGAPRKQGESTTGAITRSLAAGASTKRGMEVQDAELAGKRGYTDYLRENMAATKEDRVAKRKEQAEKLSPVEVYRQKMAIDFKEIERLGKLSKKSPEEIADLQLGHLSKSQTQSEIDARTEARAVYEAGENVAQGTFGTNVDDPYKRAEGMANQRKALKSREDAEVAITKIEKVGMKVQNIDYVKRTLVVVDPKKPGETREVTY